MADPLYLPVTDTAEIRNLLKGFPLVVDGERFVDFALGFPRRYLVQTPRLEMVKHFLLAENLGNRKVITSLAQDNSRWRLSLVTRDRSGLFALISGTLSCWGANILTAEAFANAHSVVLDTLLFEDPEQRFREPAERHRFQAMLEDVISGEQPLEPLLADRWPDISTWEPEPLEVSFDNQSYARETVMELHCRDRFGLLYLVSRHLAEQGISIDMAYIRTEAQQAADQFYLTREGRKLNAVEIETLQCSFASFPMPRFESPAVRTART